MGGAWEEEGEGLPVLEEEGRGGDRCLFVELWKRRRKGSREEGRHHEERNDRDELGLEV